MCGFQPEHHGKRDGGGNRFSFLGGRSPVWHRHCSGHSRTVQGGVQGLDNVGVGHRPIFCNGEFDKDFAFYAVSPCGFGIGHFSSNETHDFGSTAWEFG